MKIDIHDLLAVKLGEGEHLIVRLPADTTQRDLEIVRDCIKEQGGWQEDAVICTANVEFEIGRSLREIPASVG